ncbi:MAG: HD domain-containing protein [Spirochaetaceae bacterium]|jgi:putative hydrolase of HD superfamily|nr:HD domain-containing protein [Spirochaetaceae bacterium]
MINIHFDKRLEDQLNFIIEIDKLKTILRQSLIFTGNEGGVNPDNLHFENDAEHSWTIAVMALVLKEYVDFEVDLPHAIEMLLIHDIVEVDAGDVSVYSKERANAHEKEVKAADRVFGMLGTEQKKYFIDLWNEFEEKKTNEAKFAGIFDRLEPLLQNYTAGGYTWKKWNVSYDMVVEKNIFIKEASEKLWQFALALLDDAVEKGYLSRAT